VEVRAEDALELRTWDQAQLGHERDGSAWAGLRAA
jgi:hypothetical protein